MLSISLLCVGKLKERYWREACAEYVKRLGGFCKINVVEVDEQRLPERPSVAEIGAALKAEGARLLAKIPAPAKSVLNPPGTAYDFLVDDLHQLQH